jgi:hypothetical protein
VRATQILAGIAVGAVLGLGGVAAADLVTEDAEARPAGDFATKAELQAANARASAAINMGKRVWNLLGIYAAEPSELVGAKSGPITQRRGVGGGIPSSLLRDQRPAAFATVSANGTVDSARSALAGARVVKGQGAASVGFYCVYDLPFTPRSAVASANIDSSRSTAPFRAGAMTYVNRPGDPPAISGCDLTGLQVIVNTYAAQGPDVGDNVDWPFSLRIEG